MQTDVGEGEGRGEDSQRLKKAYLFGAPFAMSNIMTFLQPLENLVDRGFFLAQLLHLQSLSTTSRLLSEILESLGHEFNILDAQFLIDDGEISNGIHVALDVNDLRIVKASNDLEDGIDSTNMGKERIS